MPFIFVNSSGLSAERPLTGYVLVKNYEIADEIHREAASKVLALAGNMVMVESFLTVKCLSAHWPASPTVPKSILVCVKLIYKR